MRAVLEGWSLEVAAAVRAAAEEWVATRMLALETAVAAAGDGRTDAARNAAGEGATDRRIAEVETEIRDLSRARKHRIGQDRRLPVGRPPGGRHLNRSCE